MKLKAPNAHLDIVSSTDPAFRDIVKIFGLFQNEKPGKLVHKKTLVKRTTTVFKFKFKDNGDWFNQVGQNYKTWRG